MAQNRGGDALPAHCPVPGGQATGDTCRKEVVKRGDCWAAERLASEGRGATATAYRKEVHYIRQKNPDWYDSVDITTLY